MIVVRNLSKVIKNKKEEHVILSNISLETPEKGLVLLYGKSGCGKTTLLNILEGLDKKYLGTVEIFGQNLKNVNINSYLKNDISIIFQETNFMTGYTVLENLELIFGIKKIKLNNKLFNKKLFEFNLSDFLNKRVETLSGGEKQIILLLSVYFHKSKILFCDEPTGSMDEDSEQIAISILKELSEDRLVFVVSHNVDLFSKYCDKLFTLNEGGISEV